MRCLPSVHSVSLQILATRYPKGYCANFDAQYMSEDVSCKDVPFGGPENEILLLTPFSPKINFWLIFDWT